MRDGLRFSIAMNEFTLAAICITLIVASVGYEFTHKTYPPAPAVPCPAPAVTVTPTVYLPTPKVTVKIVPVPIPTPKPLVETPDTQVSPDSGTSPVDKYDQRNVILTSGGPTIFPSRKGVVIPNSLRQ